MSSATPSLPGTGKTHRLWVVLATGARAHTPDAAVRQGPLLHASTALAAAVVQFAAWVVPLDAAAHGWNDLQLLRLG